MPNEEWEGRGVTEAKEYLRRNLRSKIDCVCPVCNQPVRLWKKRMISTAVASLVRLVAMYDGSTPIHHDDFTVSLKDRNFSQLVLWDLIRPASPRSGMENSAGTWHPTPLGIQFARRQVRVRKHKYTYNNQRVSYVEDEEDIGVVEALRNRFDYAALISLQWER